MKTKIQLKLLFQKSLTGFLCFLLSFSGIYPNLAMPLDRENYEGVTEAPARSLILKK